MMRYVVLAAAVCGLLITAVPVHADTCTFTASSGNWNLGSNWDCVVGGAQVPTGDDRAVIQSGNTCNVDIPGAVADSLEVESTATLNIQAGNKLTLDDTDDNDTTIDGTVNITASGDDIGELAFIESDQTIDGTGKIVGQDNEAKISVQQARWLRNETTIEGKLKITGGGKFRNYDTVHANTSGTLEVSTFLIEDAVAGFWKVTTSDSAVLWLDQGFNTYAQSMSGEFRIDAGILDVEVPGFHTTGDISMTGGTIDVAAGTEAVFGTE